MDYCYEHPDVTSAQNTGYPRKIRVEKDCPRCHEPIQQGDCIALFGEYAVHEHCADEMNGSDTAIEYILSDTAAFERFLKGARSQPYIQALFKEYKAASRRAFEDWAIG